MKEAIKYSFNSNVDTGLAYEDKRTLLRVLYVCTGLTLCFFGPLQWLNGQAVLGLAEGVFGLALLAGSQRLRNVSRLAPWVYLYLLCGYSFIIYLIIMPGASLSAFVWIYIIPLITYLLISEKAGVLVTLPFSLIAIAAYWTKYPELFQGPGLLDVGNAIFCGLMIMVFIHVYEMRRAAAQQELRRLAQTDSLTGVANRSSFRQALDQSIALADRSGHPLVLVMLDLDHFKTVNDRWGHEAGDRALRHICIGIHSRLRKTDLLARLGGEEFAILLPNTTLSQAIPLVETLQQHIAANPLSYRDESIPLTATFGLAGWPQNGADAKQLYRCADRHLYRGKLSGRNQLAFDDAPSALT